LQVLNPPTEKLQGHGYIVTMPTVTAKQ